MSRFLIPKPPEPFVIVALDGTEYEVPTLVGLEYAEFDEVMDGIAQRRGDGRALIDYGCEVLDRYADGWRKGLRFAQVEAVVTQWLSSTAAEAGEDETSSE